MEAVVGLLGGIIGAIIGAWCAVSFQRAAGRRQIALQLLERYTSPEFFLARAATWRIRHVWTQGDRSCVDFFVRRQGLVNDPDAESKCGNGLTPHQNLSWLLHFFASLNLYYEAKLVDARLLKKLFEPHYQWYEQFLHEFFDEYQSRNDAGSGPQPVWLTALPRLEAMFRKTEA